jgi:hypothetical protein
MDGENKLRLGSEFGNKVFHASISVITSSLTKEVEEAQIERFGVTLQNYVQVRRVQLKST